LANTPPTIVCEDPSIPADVRPRIVIDFAEQTVLFENCHESREFLAAGAEPQRLCSFEEILAAHDFFTGERRKPILRLLLKLGWMVNSATTSGDMESIIISTSGGRCRVFAKWQAFDQLREALRQMTEGRSAGHWSDDPRLIPVYVVFFGAVVGGIIWLLL